jgi:hypothetical protein
MEVVPRLSAARERTNRRFGTLSGGGAPPPYHNSAHQRSQLVRITPLGRKTLFNVPNGSGRTASVICSMDCYMNH